MTEKFILSPKQAWEAFEAQLDHTAEVIAASRKYRKYADDSGDYLFSALELARDFQAVAMDADDNAMVDKFFELAAFETNSLGEPMPRLFFFACDGIAPAVVEIVENISGHKF